MSNPSLGSIRFTGYGQMNKKEYILKSEDVNKLSLIENAGVGSTAFCFDTGQLYITHDNTWYEVSVSNDES